MGVSVLFETGTDLRCPYGFTGSDSKAFYNYVLYAYPQEDFNRLMTHFGLSRACLDLVADGETSFNHYRIAYQHSELTHDEVLEQWQHQQDQNVRAWQAPSSLIECIDAILTTLRDHPDIFTQLNITTPYIVSGRCEQDFRDLARMATWAEEQGLERVRLTAI